MFRLRRRHGHVRGSISPARFPQASTSDILWSLHLSRAATVTLDLRILANTSSTTCCAAIGYRAATSLKGNQRRSTSASSPSLEPAPGVSSRVVSRQIEDTLREAVRRGGREQSCLSVPRQWLLKHVAPGCVQVYPDRQKSSEPAHRATKVASPLS